MPTRITFDPCSPVHPHASGKNPKVLSKDNCKSSISWVKNLHPGGGSAAMKAYQVYSIDENGAVTDDRLIEAESDIEALFAARALQRPRDTEVWYRDRRVGKIPAHH